jgi:hypothetical protein
VHLTLHHSFTGLVLFDEMEDDPCPPEHDDHIPDSANRMIQAVGTDGFNPMENFSGSFRGHVPP